MADVFSILVFQGGLDPRYILDEMGWLELHILVKNLYRAKQDDWEIGRQTIYTSAKVMGVQKRLTHENLCPYHGTT